MLHVISGCSGGGKTTLIDAIASLGFAISDEPGRMIVREEMVSGGSALPWKNPAAFSRKCVELSIHKFCVAVQSGTDVFFDRSLVDAVTSLMHEEPDHADRQMRLLNEYRYASTVFMAPPWPENFEKDPERRHSFKDAVAEYDRLVTTYTVADYSLLILPKLPLTERIDFILAHIE